MADGEVDSQKKGLEARAAPESKQRELLLEERIGRALGLAFRRVKRTQLWRRTVQAYQEGLEGQTERQDKV